MSDEVRPVTGLHFPKPVVVVDLGLYEAMTAKVEKLERELKEAKDRIDRLGYRFVGERMELHIFRSPDGVFNDDVFVRVPEMRIRAADTVEPYYLQPRSTEEAMEMHFRKREAAVERAMRQAAETWVRHFHELAGKMMQT